MKKFLLLALLIVLGIIAAYVAFVIAAIKMTIGAILLGIALIAGLAVWIFWKIKD